MITYSRNYCLVWPSTSLTEHTTGWLKDIIIEKYEYCKEPY